MIFIWNNDSGEKHVNAYVNMMWAKKTLLFDGVDYVLLFR